MTPAGDDARAKPLGAGVGVGVGVLWALIAAAFAARIALACGTWGTIDVLNYIRHAHDIDRVGVIGSYAQDPTHNHPPMPMLAGWIALVVAGRDAFRFATTYRLGIVLADFGTTLLLRRIMLARGASPRAATAVAAMYAWNPCALLVSGYHLNTDPVVAMFSLLALHLLQDRGRPLLGGLALGAAINVKLIPVLLIPSLLLAAKSRREVLHMLAGLAVMSTPYLVLLAFQPVFRGNVLGYKSSPDPWGILLFLRTMFPAGINADGAIVAADHPALFYNKWGTWLVFACAAAWAVFARRSGRSDRYVLAGVTYALFLVLASGFGVQYLILAAPLLYLTADARFANLYGVLCGVFLLAAYYYYWDGTWPISSLFSRPFPNPLAAFGLAPWAMLIYYLVRTLRRPPPALQT